ncbi:alpha/beta hydrolase [Flagellimonas sp. HMM57]|uniref:alpha/beta hydrolase n=1 Tax=unclassified Flagellimonas TaxID=2644544 RepID=UPI0013D40B0C|nr:MULTISPECIES: alpha/beta fold hydrolase [unclassified Flagellimonas]UII75995.1 alpha/beta hydrolase [Flagellimonas sp. HMM57]
MKSSILTLIIAFIFTNTVVGQFVEESITLKTETGAIEGTLLIPESSDKVPVVLIIAGSGPTDRNGNFPMFSNNSLKMLAEGLYGNGIASLRFDKRGIGESKEAGTDESHLRFEHYIDDVKAWNSLLKKDKRFENLVVLGHSEGSLIGMISAQNSNVDKYISLAGAGFPAGEIIMKQLKAAQPDSIINQASSIIKKLEHGDTEENVPQTLIQLFRKSVQPYLISWFKYNPAIEISKLDCPTLILQGTTDIQVSVEDANTLAEAKKDSKKMIIENMDHVLKMAQPDREEVFATYIDPKLPLHKDLIPEIVDFINADNR